jgi:hypothetical protein
MEFLLNQGSTTPTEQPQERTDTYTNIMWDNLRDLIEKAPKPITMRLSYCGDHIKVFFINLTDMQEYNVYKNGVFQQMPITHQSISPRPDTSQVESNGEVIFEVLNKWVYNDVNSAGDTIHIIDACDLPKIIPEIIESLKTR